MVKVKVYLVNVYSIDEQQKDHIVQICSNVYEVKTVLHTKKIALSFSVSELLTFDYFFLLLLLLFPLYPYACYN